jgi:uncharacterized protein YceK
MTRRALILMCALLAGCAHVRHSSAPAPTPNRTTATTQPILYRRTGGIAGTDDRVVIWPDGVVQVDGKLLPPGQARITPQAHERLRQSFAGWNHLRESYLGAAIADAYTISISYGDRTVEASDLAADLPELFRTIFTDIEAIAAQTQAAEPKSP